MKVTIPIVFEVEAEDVELTESEATAAAETAAFDYLSFCEISGYSGDVESVTVHVEGFGECTVKLVWESYV